MSNDIRDIIERLAILEGRITPVDVKHGLNADQKSVKQLPALFKPRDISPTLSKKPYQKHPMDGWLVGEEEDEGNFGEGIESEKLPDSAGHKLTKAGTVGNVHASKGKASSEVTDETGSETKGHPLDHKSPLTKAGTVGNLKAGSSLFGSK